MSTNRVHYYHADNTALGGHIETPFKRQIPVAAPLSLPPTGGYAFARAERFSLEGILSFESAHTQVAGSVSPKTGGWTTLASSVVEGLNILDVITIDRVVAQVATEHPLVGYTPRVTFVGTRFENLCVAGNLLKPVLNLDICGAPLPQGQYPAQSVVEDNKNNEFLKTVEEHYNNMNNADKLPKWVKNREIPSWVGERYKWDNAKRAAGGCVLCSLVSQVDGEFPGRPFGNVLDIPEIGKVFLGELLVDHNTFRVIGIRLELGCPVTVSASAAAASVEGTTHP